jgi:CheY-like chemotaxis protein/HPt (histidine-containing phosphotransfer) domain-containing protein
VSNAIKFTRRGEVVIAARVRAADGGRREIECSVTDTGIGMSPDALAKIFQPFSQADDSITRRFGGTGLGLSISRRFARALGGDIVARSTPGSGSTFTVTVDPGPLDGVRFVGEEALERPAAAAAKEGARWRFPAARVLIVDDGDENRELLRALLEDYGFALEEAVNGAEAVARVEEGGIDLVLMDVQMPVMDGMTATRRLREAGCTTPIVALTANVMTGATDGLAQAGFTDYEAKPVVVDSLLATLGRLLGGERVAPDQDGAGPEEALPNAGTAPVTALPRPAANDAPAAAIGPAIVSRLAANPRFHRAVRSFAGRVEARLAEMERALEAADWTGLRELAHWLKGAGGTVGFDCFTEPAAQLEGDARSGDAPACARALRHIAALVARIEVPDDPKSVTDPAA